MKIVNIIDTEKFFYTFSFSITSRIPGTPYLSLRFGLRAEGPNLKEAPRPFRFERFWCCLEFTIYRDFLQPRAVRFNSAILIVKDIPVDTRA